MLLATVTKYEISPVSKYLIFLDAVSCIHNSLAENLMTIRPIFIPVQKHKLFFMLFLWILSKVRKYTSNKGLKISLNFVLRNT
jgi:hypothetical protein